MSTEPAVTRIDAPTVEVRTLIGALDRELSGLYSAEQRHGLSLDAIFRPEIRFFLAWRDGDALGCGGIALLNGYAEVKRMYVRDELRGQGIARAILHTLETEALACERTIIRLESGIHQPAALRLYEHAGYRRRAAFGSYLDLPPDHIATSVFLEKDLAAATAA